MIFETEHMRPPVGAARALFREDLTGMMACSGESIGCCRVAAGLISMPGIVDDRP
jgi:hypothetical protein